MSDLTLVQQVANLIRHAKAEGGTRANDQAREFLSLIATEVEGMENEALTRLKQLHWHVLPPTEKVKLKDQFDRLDNRYRGWHECRQAILKKLKP